MALVREDVSEDDDTGAPLLLEPPHPESRSEQAQDAVARLRNKLLENMTIPFMMLR